MTRPYDADLTTYAFAHARDIMLVIDADDGRILDANRAAELAYGYPRGALLARTIYELRSNDPTAVGEQIERAASRGTLFETVHRRHDGSTFAAEVSSRGETIGERRVLFSVIRDITERQRQQREREALIETTQRALELRDEFLLVASHELRTPVTNISLQLQHQLRMLEPDTMPPEIVATTRAALVELTRLSELVSALLDAQAARDGIVLARGPLDLAELVASVTARLRARPDCRSPVILDVAPTTGHWDRLRLDQVFTNLLVNAHKYGRGHPIHLTSQMIGAAVQVEIHDRGIGVAAADSARIFDKFERAVPAAYGGFGLGLYITRQLVEAHGGSIELHSTPGEGSTFRVTLPLAAP